MDMHAAHMYLMYMRATDAIYMRATDAVYVQSARDVLSSGTGWRQTRRCHDVSPKGDSTVASGAEFVTTSMASSRPYFFVLQMVALVP